MKLTICSEFVFDPASWPREVMDIDFLNIKKLFNADQSLVRVPGMDPKFKIAILASKQVQPFLKAMILVELGLFHSS